MLRRAWNNMPLAWLNALIIVAAALAFALLVIFWGFAMSWASTQEQNWIDLALIGALTFLVSIPMLKRNGPVVAQEQTQTSVDSRIAQATEALASAAGLVDELQSEMSVRSAALERLKLENDDYEKLAAVRQQEAEAVSRLVANVIAKTHADLEMSNRRDQRRYFLYGLAASIPVGIIINLLIR